MPRGLLAGLRIGPVAAPHEVDRALLRFVLYAAAVFSSGGHEAVWVVRDGKAVRVTVTLGVQGPDKVQVTSGVNAGDRVVVRGADRVKQGQTLP